jgi:uncharacterized membrane protein
MGSKLKSNSGKKSAVSASTRVIACLLCGIVAAWFTGTSASWKYAPLAGWDTAAIVFLIWIYISLYGRDAEETAQLAKREDPSHPLADVLLVCASVASLAAVGALLIQAGSAAGGQKVALIALALMSIVISWFIVHTIYALKYARLYYKNDGGIDFYTSTPPRYSDFAYVAFTIGMTFQISDNNFENNDFRRTALRHALLSFLFGTVILATVINFIAGLGK